MRATLPYREVEGQLKIPPTEASFPRPVSLVCWLACQLLVGWRPPELAFGGPQDEWISSPSRILKVYIEALTEFHHVYNPNRLKNTLLSQG